MNVKKNEKQANSLPKVFTFNPSNQPIRVEVINNEPWFVAADVCQALELSDTGKTVERLDNDEKLMRTVFVSGQNRQMWHVNESGLYNLIFQSRKPEAKAFRKWVTSEVLPNIRKTGSYTMPQSTSRYIRRGEGVNADILNLLWLIGEYLVAGDQKDIALQLGVSTVSVCNVINGRQRSNRILTALYNRARSNRDAGLIDFYQRPGQMTDRLLGISNGGMTAERRILHSGQAPMVIERPRGAQHGNKNAQKGGKL